MRSVPKSKVRSEADTGRPKPTGTKIPPSPSSEPVARGAPARDDDDPPIRLAHVLFVLWVAGSVAWAFCAAQLAHGLDWWVQAPELGAILVLAPPVIAHVLAIHVLKITGNPRFR